MAYSSVPAQLSQETYHHLADSLIATGSNIQYVSLAAGNLDYEKFRPTLKMTQRKVIYLTKDEIARVRDLELSESQAYLNPIRDIFLFCCFSGLRHSDYKAMKPYIDIVDSIKASSMTKFDGLI